MKTKRTLLILSLGTVVLFGLSASTVLLPATQSNCVQASRVSINAGITSLNVRETPITGRALGSVSQGQTFMVLAIDPSSCWLKITTTTGITGWISNGTQFVTVLTIATPTRTPSATRTATQGVTPTRIITFTPIPAAERTKTASQYSERLCVAEPGEGFVCFLYPFGTTFEIETVPNNH